MITDSEPALRRRANPSASACEPYREGIEQAVLHGRHAMAIWRALVDDHGFRSSYPSVGRFVKKLRAESGKTVEAHPVIETAAGEEGQVDYGGDGPMVLDPNTLLALTFAGVGVMTWVSRNAFASSDPQRRLIGIGAIAMPVVSAAGLSASRRSSPMRRRSHRDACPRR